MITQFNANAMAGAFGLVRHTQATDATGAAITKQNATRFNISTGCARLRRREDKGAGRCALTLNALRLIHPQLLEGLQPFAGDFIARVFLPVIVEEL
jgi:hypothetical protein